MDRLGLGGNIKTLANMFFQSRADKSKFQKTYLTEVVAYIFIV